MFNLLFEVGELAAAEGQLAHDQLVGDHAQTPHVGLL